MDQSLVERPHGLLCHPPEIFPDLVGFEIPARVKINYSFVQEIPLRHTLYVVEKDRI